MVFLEAACNSIEGINRIFHSAAGACFGIGTGCLFGGICIFDRNPGQDVVFRRSCSGVAVMACIILLLGGIQLFCMGSWGCICENIFGGSKEASDLHLRGNEYRRKRRKLVVEIPRG